jgi:hypothetical protein
MKIRSACTSKQMLENRLSTSQVVVIQFISLCSNAGHSENVRCLISLKDRCGMISYSFVKLLDVYLHVLSNSFGCLALVHLLALAGWRYFEFLEFRSKQSKLTGLNSVISTSVLCLSAFSVKKNMPTSRFAPFTKS